jgi:hypothetical protein
MFRHLLFVRAHKQPDEPINDLLIHLNINNLLFPAVFPTDLMNPFETTEIERRCYNALKVCTPKEFFPTCLMYLKCASEMLAANRFPDCQLGTGQMLSEVMDALCERVKPEMLKFSWREPLDRGMCDVCCDEARSILDLRWCKKYEVLNGVFCKEHKFNCVKRRPRTEENLEHALISNELNLCYSCLLRIREESVKLFYTGSLRLTDNAGTAESISCPYHYPRWVMFNDCAASVKFRGPCYYDDCHCSHDWERCIQRKCHGDVEAPVEAYCSSHNCGNHQYEHYAHESHGPRCDCGAYCSHEVCEEAGVHPPMNMCVALCSLLECKEFASPLKCWNTHMGHLWLRERNEGVEETLLTLCDAGVKTGVPRREMFEIVKTVATYLGRDDSESVVLAERVLSASDLPQAGLGIESRDVNTVVTNEVVMNDDQDPPAESKSTNSDMLSSGVRVRDASFDSILCREYLVEKNIS